MDSLIYAFVDDTFTSETKEDIFKCFEIFDKFDYKDVESEFLDILNNSSYATAGDTQDMFVSVLNNKVDYVINQHSVKLATHTTLEQKIEICLAFYNFQHLEDYTGIIRILESFESDYEKLSSIISNICSLEQVSILSILESIDDKLLSNMKKYIYTLEETKYSFNTDSVIINKARMFFKYINELTIGEQLFRDGMLSGESFETYLTFCEDNLVTNKDDQTAKNILSILMLSADGSNSPLLVYKKYSFRLLQDLNKTSKVESHVLKILNNFEDYKKAQHEKDRLSKISNTAKNS
jgi:hypothetical protein